MTPETGHRLAQLLEAHTGQELTQTRQWRVGTALAALMREADCADVDALMARVDRDWKSPLARRIVEALLNNETYFFRDPAMFEHLASSVLPRLAEARASTRRLSIWCAGCSTGQEPLSLAMMLAEQGSRWADWTIDILATDVSETAVASARAGCYTQFQIQRGLGVVQMLRWFSESPAGWQASPDLLRRIRYFTHNMLEPLPIGSRFDLVLCRNVLLYFDQPTRERAYGHLAGVVAPDGFLMLGAGETVVGHSGLFVPEKGMAGMNRPATPNKPDEKLRLRTG